MHQLLFFRIQPPPILHSILVGVVDGLTSDPDLESVNPVAVRPEDVIPSADILEMLFLYTEVYREPAIEATRSESLLQDLVQEVRGILAVSEVET